MSEDDGVELTVRVGAKQGGVTLCVRVPRGSVGLSSVVPFARQLTDIMVEQAITREQEQGRTLSCASGCAACCRQLVALSAPEVFAIADHVVGLAAEPRDEVMDRFDRLVAIVEQRGALPLLDRLSRGFGDSRLATVGTEYFALCLACPLLVDECCVAYAARPLSCRLHSVTSPAEHCSHPTPQTVCAVPMPPSLSRPLALLTAKLVGGRPEPIPLTLALQWAEEHVALAAERWPAVDLFEGFLETLESSGVGQVE